MPRRSPGMRLTQLAPVYLILVVLATANGAQTPKSAPASTAKEGETSAAPGALSSTASNPRAPVLREGAELVNQIGQFRVTGDRITFFTADGMGRLIVLENLNLQRIVRVLSENVSTLDWKVNGTVTEYRGANYLYVRSAVLKAGTEVRENAAP